MVVIVKLLYILKSTNLKPLLHWLIVQIFWLLYSLTCYLFLLLGLPPHNYLICFINFIKCVLRIFINPSLASSRPYSASYATIPSIFPPSLLIPTLQLFHSGTYIMKYFVFCWIMDPDYTRNSWWCRLLRCVHCVLSCNVLFLCSPLNYFYFHNYS
jgi:hypothetical protein